MTTTSMDVVDQEAERKKLKKEKKRKVGRLVLHACKLFLRDM